MSSLPLNYPEEYLQGEVEFFYHKFFINDRVLIPRFETETLVRTVLQDAKTLSPDVLIDVGTGSGIIPISIALHRYIPTIYGCDISSDALEIAKKNSTHHQINIQWLQSDLLSVLLEKNLLEFEDRNIIVTANLPYIKEGDFEHLGAWVIFEPHQALFGGPKTGFELYERLTRQLLDFQRIAHLKSLTAYIEMGYDQKNIAEAFLSKLKLTHAFFADPAGINRFIRIVFPPQ